MILKKARILTTGFYLLFLTAGVLFSEPDNGKWLPGLKTPFDYTNIYFQIDPARLQMPMYFFSQSAFPMTRIGYGAAFEAGYNWDGWLFGVRWNGAYYGRGETGATLVNAFSHTNFSFQLSKILAKPLFDFFPKYLEIVPNIGFGADILTADYYRSHRAKDLGLNKVITFGQVAVFSMNFGVHIDLNFGFDQFIPYIGFDSTLFFDKGYEYNLPGYENIASDGSGFFYSLTLGVRTYLFKIKKPSLAPARLEITAQPQPFYLYQDAVKQGGTVKIYIDGVFKSALKSWVVQIFTPEHELIKTFTEGSQLVSPLVWRGETDGGGMVETSGIYTARIIAADARKETLTAETVIEVRYIPREPAAEELPKAVTPPPPVPEISTFALPRPFSPDADGLDDTARITVRAVIPDRAKSWTIQIYDSQDKPFKHFAGTGNAPEQILWDGKSDSGELVQSRQTYPYTVSVTDEKNTVHTAKADILTDLLVRVETPDTIRIVVSNIFFDPDAATFNKIPEAQRKSNIETLDSVARQIVKYPGYELTIEGHANNVSNTQKENIEELIPLSQRRAERIKQELINRGIDAERMVPVGEGGNRPLVKWENRAEWWKNRRIEFILRKTQGER